MLLLTNTIHLLLLLSDTRTCTYSCCRLYFEVSLSTFSHSASFSTKLVVRLPKAIIYLTRQFERRFRFYLFISYSMSCRPYSRRLRGRVLNNLYLFGRSVPRLILGVRSFGPTTALFKNDENLGHPSRQNRFRQSRSDERF